MAPDRRLFNGERRPKDGRKTGQKMLKTGEKHERRQKTSKVPVKQMHYHFAQRQQFCTNMYTILH